MLNGVVVNAVVVVKNEVGFSVVVVVVICFEVVVGIVIEVVVEFGAPFNFFYFSFYLQY